MIENKNSSYTFLGDTIEDPDKCNLSVMPDILEYIHQAIIERICKYSLTEKIYLKWMCFKYKIWCYKHKIGE